MGIGLALSPKSGAFQGSRSLVVAELVVLLIALVALILINALVYIW